MLPAAVCKLTSSPRSQSGSAPPCPVREGWVFTVLRHDLVVELKMIYVTFHSPDTMSKGRHTGCKNSLQTKQ